MEARVISNSVAGISDFRSTLSGPWRQETRTSDAHDVWKHVSIPQPGKENKDFYRKCPLPCFSLKAFHGTLEGSMITIEDNQVMGLENRLFIGCGQWTGIADNGNDQAA